LATLVKVLIKKLHIDTLMNTLGGASNSEARTCSSQWSFARWRRPAESSGWRQSWCHRTAKRGRAAEIYHHDVLTTPSTGRRCRFLHIKEKDQQDNSDLSFLRGYARRIPLVPLEDITTTYCEH